MPGGSWPQLASATRTERTYWGVSSTPATTEAFIESLGNHSSTSAIRPTVVFTITASGTNKIYVARPTHYGTATFSAGGFVGGFILLASSISVTNTLGVTIPYDLYESVSSGLGTQTITVY